MNEQAYDRLADTSIRDLQDTEFYQPSEADISVEHWRQVAIYDDMLDALIANGAEFPDDGVFLDFGAGRGYAAMAASRRLRHSIVCEMYPELSKRIIDTLNIKNVTVIEQLSACPYKPTILFMWHVLEHLPDPAAFWIINRKILSDKAELIIQVPMYRPEYVVDAHFVFFNERSFNAWFHKIRANLRKTLVDEKNHFITAIGNLT